MSQYSASQFDPKDDNTSWRKTYNLIKSGSVVLDIGCSSGTFGAELIREKKCIVDGIDIDEGDLKKAQEVLRHTYKLNIETDALDLPKKYDVVFMGDVIEHLARPIPALKKVKKLLKPQGHLVFSIPNITHMSVRLMLLKGQILYGQTGLLDETHLHFYNADEIYRVLNTAGFVVDVLDYTTDDIPEEVLQAELKKIGLKPKPTFMKLAHSLNGAAYQFVGRATIASSSTTQKLPKVSPPNITRAYHEQLKKDYEANIKAVVADKERVVAEKDRRIKEYERIINRAEHQALLKTRGKLARFKHVLKPKNKVK